MSSSVTQQPASVEPHQWTDGGEHVLILRRINKDGTSHGGFNRWGSPDELNIVVEPESWSPEPECGNGLHGWPWGWALGNGSEYSVTDDRWLVLAARPEDVVSIKGGKCKCCRAMKIYDGEFAGAWAMIHGGRHRLIEAMAAGHSESCSSGDYSTSAASGYGSTSASAGFSSTSASSGYSSKAASAGNYSAAEQAGQAGIAASIGNSGTVMAGENGALVLCYWSIDEARYRVVVGYVGEDGIEPNTRYRLNDKHEFAEVTAS